MVSNKKTRNRNYFALLAVLCLSFPAWAEDAKLSGGQSMRHDTSPPLRDFIKTVVASADKKQIERSRKRPDFGKPEGKTAPDGGLQSQEVPAGALGSTPQPLLSVPGISDDDNFALYGVKYVPPNSNGDIGLNEAGERIYIQYINLAWSIFDATTGALTDGPFVSNSFWGGFGGFCETNNDGSPIVLYDDAAGRWFFSQISANQGIQCVAISATGDPLGAYHRYAFTVTPGGVNDAPRIGVWDDRTSGSNGQSAYTFTTHDFGGAGGDFSGSAGVMERDAMLLGEPALFVKFSNSCVANNCVVGQLPPHQAGPPPPEGTCPTFWSAVDAAFDDSPFANDGYRNHTLCVDWTTIGNSTYTEGPLVVAGSNFDRFISTISPILDGDILNSLAGFTMYRAQYRWFGSSASVVLNTTVDAGGDRAGIRWAETRSTDGDSGWTLHQDGTYAPDDGLERWMGSIAQDRVGNIALGYSVAGPALWPGIRYTTRMSGDDAGTLPGGEVSCHEGGGAQTNNDRWGDLSSMSVDPADGCTFWYTQEYYETTGSFDFSTRICSFKLSNCKGVIPVFPTIIDDFESGLPTGTDTDGNAIGFVAFHDGSSSAAIATTSTPPAPVPGSAAGNQVMQVDTSVIGGGFAGFVHAFENETVDTWTPQDWSAFNGLSFWLYGNNTGSTLFLEVLDNRNDGSTSDDAERFSVDIIDDFSGWQFFEVPWEAFARREIGNGAPNDGFTLTQVHGWAFGVFSSELAFINYIDDVGLFGDEILDLIFADGFEG